MKREAVICDVLCCISYDFALQCMVKLDERMAVMSIKFATTMCIDLDVKGG